MAGQDAAGILNVNAALKHGLYQVAQGANARNYNRYYHPLVPQQVMIVVADDECNSRADGYATNKAFPGFFRRMAFKSLGAPHSHPYKVRPGIVCPKQ